MSSLKKWAKSVVKHPEKLLNPMTYTYDVGKAAMEDVGTKYVDFYGELNGTNAQRRAAELQNDYNLQYWKMQNEYNTPSAQMQRFIDAGLNPNLAYSLSNTAGDVGRVSVGTADSLLGTAGKVISAISAWQGIKNMRLQNENLAYQGDFVQEQARRMRIDNNWLESNGLSTFSPVLERNVNYGTRLYDSMADFISGVSDMLTHRSLNESRSTIMKYQRDAARAQNRWNKMRYESQGSMRYNP